MARENLEVIVFVRSASLGVTPAVSRYVSALREFGFGGLIQGLELAYLGRRSSLEGLQATTSMSSPFETTRQRAIALLRWQVFQLVTLWRLRPRVIQLCDVFSVAPAVAAKFLFGSVLVFDIRDNAKLAVGHRSHGLGLLLGAVEAVGALASDEVIVVSLPLKAILPARARAKATVVPNAPAADSFCELRFSEGKTLRVNLSGFVSFRRNLDAWLRAAVSDGGVTLDLYGNVADERTAEILRQYGMSPVLPCGREDAIHRMQAADVVSLMYDPAIEINRFAAPNKLYEALMLGKPVLCARGMRMAEELEERDCGFAVDYGDEGALREAIARLRAPGARERMGANGRRLFVESYRGVAAMNIRSLYERLGLITPAGQG